MTSCGRIAEKITPCCSGLVGSFVWSSGKTVCVCPAGTFGTAGGTTCSPLKTTKNITPLQWPGTNIQDQCVNGGSAQCPDGNFPFQLTNIQACGTYCKTSVPVLGCVQEANKYAAECGPAEGTSKASAMCPAISGMTPVSFIYSAGLRGNKGSAGTSVKIKCDYGGTPTETVLFGSTLSDYFDGNDTTDPIKTLRGDFCATKGFVNLQNHTNCQNYYRSNNNLNARYIELIKAEKPTTWPDDQAMREVVLSVSLGVDPATNAQTPDAQVASTMISKYCLVDNPSGWAQNANMRTFINQLYDSDAATARTNPYLRSLASSIVNTYCGDASNQMKTECGCYNAQTKLFAGCVGHASIPGCAEIDAINTKLDAAPPAFASIIATLRSPAGIKPTCVSAACVEARENPGGAYLRTTDAQTMDCSDKITLCMQSITAGGSISPGATINQSCSTTLNIQGNTVPAAGGLNLNANIQQRGDNITVNEGDELGTAPPGSVMVRGNAYPLNDFIIKPGKSKFVDSYLETPEKQKGALGGAFFILFCCCILLLLLGLSGGDDSPAPRPGLSPEAFARIRIQTSGL